MSAPRRCWWTSSPTRCASTRAPSSARSPRARGPSCRWTTPGTRAITGRSCRCAAPTACTWSRTPLTPSAPRGAGAPVGSFADVTAFSFYATKNLTTGEGGAAVTADDALAERMALLSLHGMSRDAWKRYGDTGSWYYEVTAPGFKYNFSDVLAALGLGQLERFEGFQRRRAEIVARYDAGLAGVAGVRTMRARPDVTHARHLYPIALELERLTLDRAAFIRELRAENIGTSVHFIPIHFHPHFARTLGRREGDFPVAEDAYRRAVTLPLFPRMSDRDADDVVAAVIKVAAHFAR